MDVHPLWSVIHPHILSTLRLQLDTGYKNAEPGMITLYTYIVYSCLSPLVISIKQYHKPRI